MNKIKMLVIPSDRTGVGYFRSLSPHQYIQEHYGDAFDIDIVYELPNENLEDFFKPYDIVHIHKMLDRDCNIIKMLKFLGKKVIIDIDDHWNLGDDHPLSVTAKKEKWAEPVINSIRLADYVTTTTDIFADVIRKHNKNVYVFPNAIDQSVAQYQPKEVPSEKIRFGIICGSSHLKDIQLIGDVTRTLPQEILDKIQIVLCGFDTNGTKTIFYQDTGETVRRPIEPKESVWYQYEKILTGNYRIVSKEHERFLNLFIPNSEYPNYTNEPYRRCWTKNINEYATHYNNIDVLLAPLKENEFNKVKSQLKAIEAGFMGKAIIAQEFGPYTLDLKPMLKKGNEFDETGNALLVPSNKNNKFWAKYIKWLVENPDKIKLLQENLAKDIKEKYSIETVCKSRVEFYQKIVNE